jgi:CheY-like chemotaxis protein
MRRDGMPDYVLAIDDSATVLAVIETALAGIGHRALGAGDHEPALARVREAGSPPRLILLDDAVPGRDAAELCRRLAGDPALARVPVVLMTTRGQAADLEARFARLPNVVDSIGKPFAPDALQAVVTRVAGAGAAAGPAGAVQEALALSAGGGPAEARDFAALGYALAGDLDAIPMGQVFELLSEQRQTGTLRVLNAASHARVDLAFRGGRIEFGTAAGVAEDLMLGRFVVETGEAGPEVLGAVLEERARSTAPRPLFGADLIARGLLSRDALTRALLRQTSELAYETLRWTAGFFHFRRNADPGPAAREAGLQIHVERMLLEGFRRIDEWRVIEREISTFDEVFVRNEPKIDELPRGTLTREELAVLDEIDGRRTVRDVVRNLRMGSFDVSKICFRLRRARMIRTRLPPTAA